MKLKNLLVLAFAGLTLIPTVIMALLLYRSGLNLSQESHARNLVESITIQEDYIAQEIDHSLIADSRFAKRLFAQIEEHPDPKGPQKENLLAAFQTYLENSQDKISVCMLLNKDNTPIYALGEKVMQNAVQAQIPALSAMTDQKITEFKLEKGDYSLGVITPVHDNQGRYLGSLVSVYSQHYIFKIISSYYKIADTATYICRENGELVNFRKLPDETHHAAIVQALKKVRFAANGNIDMTVDGIPLSGYYTKIHRSPWYLVGFVDENKVYAFANHFIFLYIFVIMVVFIADIALSFYFSQKVVAPIKSLIKVMEGYQNNLCRNIPEDDASEQNYFEISYLRSKFSDLMKTIMLVQHNFEGVYQLYQSSAMGDTNIDIDVKEQTVVSNKDMFQTLMREVPVPEGACVVEHFVRCFSEKDQNMLMDMFEKMRDEHLSVPSEAEVHTPYFNEKWYHILVVPMYEDDRLSRLFIQLRDVSSFKKQEFESIEQARRDPLTGLYNRTGFTDRVNHAMQASVKESLHGLLFIDMDYFKLVNDNLGHSAGDELLRAVGSTLLEVAGPDSIVARLGGDEFAVCLPRTTSGQLEEVKREINRRLVFPFATDAISFVVSASIGAATWYSASSATLDEVLRQADDDMYRAKRAFKQCTNRDDLR